MPFDSAQARFSNAGLIGIFEFWGIKIIDFFGIWGKIGKTWGGIGDYGLVMKFGGWGCSEWVRWVRKRGGFFSVF